MFSDRKKNTTILEALQKQIVNLKYSKGCEILRIEEINRILRADGVQTLENKNEKEEEKQMIEQAKDLAKEADIILLALGEHYRQSGEACSRSNLELPKNQIELIEELHKLGKPMIMILFNGRPLQLSNIENKLDSILEVWFPGTMGAEAITDVLLGNTNPSGKLTMSFPQNVGQCPIYYNHYNTGRPHNYEGRYLSRYQDIPTESFYPFGYGLSYCKFEYKNLKLDKTEIDENEKINVTVEIENKSDFEGYEVVQMYIQDLFGSVVRPVKELKGFKKVYFKAYETKKVEFEITMEMLKFWNERLEFKEEKGDFKVYVGGNSMEVLEGRFKIK